MTFYRYIYFSIYRFFENLKATNAHNSALGILSVPLMLTVYKVHSLVSKHLLDQRLDFNKIAIPYLIVFFVIYAANYFLLERNSTYLKTEDFFKRKGQPEYYNPLMIGMVVIMAVIFIL